MKSTRLSFATVFGIIVAAPLIFYGVLCAVNGQGKLLYPGRFNRRSLEAVPVAGDAAQLAGAAYVAFGLGVYLWVGCAGPIRSHKVRVLLGWIAIFLASAIAFRARNL